jgi:hypothetical protein
MLLNEIVSIIYILKIETLISSELVIYIFYVFPKLWVVIIIKICNNLHAY